MRAGEEQGDGSKAFIGFRLGKQRGILEMEIPQSRPTDQRLRLTVILACSGSYVFSIRNRSPYLHSNHMFFHQHPSWQTTGGQSNRPGEKGEEGKGTALMPVASAMPRSANGI